jgi:hypothetical protein
MPAQTEANESSLELTSPQARTIEATAKRRQCYRQCDTHETQSTITVARTSDQLGPVRRAIVFAENPLGYGPCETFDSLRVYLAGNPQAEALNTLQASGFWDCATLLEQASKKFHASLRALAKKRKSKPFSWDELKRDALPIIDDADGVLWTIWQTWCEKHPAQVGETKGQQQHSRANRPTLAELAEAAGVSNDTVKRLAKKAGIAPNETGRGGAKRTYSAKEVSRMLEKSKESSGKTHQRCVKGWEKWVEQH